MRTITALEVRAKFGQVIDEAAAGERFIVERAGVPVAAIVPLSDLSAVSPEQVIARRLEAISRIVALRRLDRGTPPSRDEVVDLVRSQRDETLR
jgi:prevent-host-death family protein